MKLLIREFDTPQAKIFDPSSLISHLDKKFPGEFIIQQTAVFKHSENTNSLYWNSPNNDCNDTYNVIIQYVDGWIGCLESM